MNRLLASAVLSISLLGLSGCGESGPTPEELEAFKASVKANMIPIEGGTFMMGDQGRMVEINGEMRHLFWSPHSKDDKPAFKVTLSDFSIYKQPVSFAEYDIYRKANKLPLYKIKWLESDRYDQSINVKYKDLRAPNMTAIPETWDDAQKYCQWVGEQLGEKWSLPTEAQFEYSARNRGENVRMATPDGSENADLIFPKKEMPVGSMAPNKLGLYQMNVHRTEWVLDWYRPDFKDYKGKHLIDPQGPDTGDEKVRKGGSYNRLSSKSFNTYYRSGWKIDKKGSSANAWRCVKNN